MDEGAMKLLALEVLYKHGGYHVPLALPYNKEAGFNALVGGNIAAQVNTIFFEKNYLQQGGGLQRLGRG